MCVLCRLLYLVSPELLSLTPLLSLPRRVSGPSFEALALPSCKSWEAVALDKINECQCVVVCHPVCDETQNLNETESETFFRYQFFSIPNPILFSIPNFFRYRYRYFFRYQKNRNRYQYFYRYQNFSKPIPILSKNIEKFRNQYRYFFRYQKILKPIPVLLSIPKNFETDTIKKHRKVLEPNLKLFRSKFVDWIMSLL